MKSKTNTSPADVRALWILMGMMAISGVAGGFTIPLVVKITEFFGVADSDLGLMLGLSSVVMGVSSIPWGYWADKYRRVRLLIVSMSVILACLLSVAACFLLRLPFGAFLASNLLMGFGAAGIGPISNSMIMDSVPREQRGAALGWFGVAFVGGGGLGMLMSSGCMQLKLSLGLTYLLLLTVEGLFLLSLFLMEEPRRGLQDEALRDTIGIGKGEYGYKIELKDLKALLQKPINLLLAGIAVFGAFNPAVLYIWFVTFAMRNHGLAEFAATQLALVAFAGQPFGNVIGGMLADRAYRSKQTGRVVVMILMSALAPVFLVAAFLLPFRLFPFVPLMILANFFIGAVAPAQTAVSLEVNLPEHRGTITAFFAICLSIALGLGWLIPPLIARAFGGEYQYAMILSAGAYLPLIVTLFLIKSRIERDLDHVNKVLDDRAKKIQHLTQESPAE